MFLQITHTNKKKTNQYITSSNKQINDPIKQTHNFNKQISEKKQTNKFQRFRDYFRDFVMCLQTNF